MTAASPPSSKTHSRWPALALSLSGLLCCGVVAWTLIANRFGWHVQQPSFVHALIEAVLLWLLLATGFCATHWPRWLRLGLVVLPTLLYLRYHHVDLVLPVVWLYVEGLLALGGLLLALCREPSRRDDAWLRALIAGVALMSVWLWLWQWFGFGRMPTQRLLALILIVPALLLRWRHWQLPGLLRAAWRLPSAAARLWAVTLLVSLMLLLAHTNTTFGSDALWYGFRPERILIGEHSVFEPLGLTSPVYYFPKLYEVLLLPLSAFKENSVVLGFSIAMGAALAALGHAMLRRLGHDQTAALAGATLILSVPALANATLATKPEVFTALMVVAMIWFGWNLLTERRRWELAWVLCCAGLAVSSKLLALAYVGIGGLACLLAAGLAWRRPRAENDAPGAAPWVLTACTVAALLVCLRTQLLSGMPTIGPDLLVKFWNLLGLQLQLPVGTLSWMRPQQWSGLPELFWGWLVEPTRFSHIQIAWPSNVWLWLGVIALLGRRAPVVPGTPRWLLWAVPLTGLGLLVFVGFSNRGGDGNYFIAPVTLCIVLTLDAALRRCTRADLRRGLLIGLSLFVFFHTAYALASAAWSTGIRAWDGDFSRSPRDTRKLNRQVLRQGHLYELDLWLRDQSRLLHVVGDLPHPLGMRLAARYEDLPSIDYSLAAHPGPLSALLACARIDAVLLPLGEFKPSPHRRAREMLARFAALPAEHDLYRDAHWRLIDAQAVLARCDRNSGD